MYIKFLVSMLFLSTLNLYASEDSLDLNASQLTALRIHTSSHSLEKVRKYALIKISGLNSNCTHGVYFDPTVDKETWSLVVSAYMAEKDVRIGYEPNLGAPWGDPTYCQLTYFDIR